MKHPATLMMCLLMLPLSALAQLEEHQETMVFDSSRNQQSQFQSSHDGQLARQWGLADEEFRRYRELMDGPLGIYSPALDPLSALGIEAESDAERQRFAELQVQAEARRVEKLLAYQHAYDAAWQRLYPDLQPVSLPQAVQSRPVSSQSGRAAVFVSEDCSPCGQLVQRLQRQGAEFDLYMLDSGLDDAMIRAWANRVRIDPDRVRSGSITLNHDSGRWQALGGSGDLPAVMHQVNGQWQRQLPF